MATYQVRTDSNGQKTLSDPLTGLSSTLATSELPGAVQPDGVTTKVDSAGILSAIGGNLLMNDEIWITESGTFTAPVTGWYDVWMIGGGDSGAYYRNAVNHSAYGGASGNIFSGLLYLTQGQSIQCSIGAGGVPNLSSPLSTSIVPGGETTFGEISTASYPNRSFKGDVSCVPWASEHAASFGGGLGGGRLNTPPVWYGAGGACVCVNGLDPSITAGYQGAIRLRFWNPAKANGPSE